MVAALYFADGALRASGGGGLPLPGLALLLGPGALAAWLARRRGTPGEAEKEGVLAGLVTAQFASALLVVALVVEALNIDWVTYESQVGAEIAGSVRDAIVPAVAVAGLASLAVVYAGCVVAGWLGALIYNRLAGPK